jgi:hypothetical protein
MGGHRDIMSRLSGLQGAAGSSMTASPCGTMLTPGRPVSFGFTQRLIPGIPKSHRHDVTPRLRAALFFSRT